jgi:hypothetical protein
VLGKEEREREQKIRDTVRKTDVEVERTGGRAASRARYTGPERRHLGAAPYTGPERRMNPWP